MKEPIIQEIPYGATRAQRYCEYWRSPAPLLSLQGTVTALIKHDNKEQCREASRPFDSISTTSQLMFTSSFRSFFTHPAGPGSTRRRSSLSVQDLSSELVSVAVEWQDLGLRLGLQPWRLRQVEHDYSSCRDRLMACLDAWVRSKEDASWGDVVAALKEMEEHALAMKVEDVHCGMAIHLPGEGGRGWCCYVVPPLYTKFECRQYADIRHCLCRGPVKQLLGRPLTCPSPCHSSFLHLALALIFP